ncbi:hypothetical protein Q7C36_021180 [Tachysurus vachellii]|uniref:Ubiquitin-like protease family profile domain-containing protein n=1 Tax=Tachysurus vachellii TaxID=175792 RepID=A0AA88IS50_TACVA|nr:hypothetical protein Q7C36_021180 [Tachysurus vachellii]
MRRRKMGTPFKIPKKKQLPDTPDIRMTSPLARLQVDVTPKSPWNRDVFNGHKTNRSSIVNGRRETKPACTGTDRWRPKRASDKLCDREDNKHTPSFKKKCGLGLAEKCSSSQPEDEEDDEEGEKKMASPVRETRSANTRASVNTAVADKQNGQSTHSSSHTHSEDRAPAKLARTPKDTHVHSSDSSDCPYTRRKLRFPLKTYQRTKTSCTEPIVLSSGDEDEEHDEARGDVRLNPDLQKNHRSEVQSSSPAMIELAFSTLYFGTTRSNTNGPIMIKEECILIPLKGAECGDTQVSVCLVPSELRAYGVWDAVGSGLTELCDSSSSLLFFILSNAQARLLHTELSALHKDTTAPPSPFVLVQLIGRLDDLQEATIASLMEIMSVRNGHTSLGTALSREEGLKRVTCHRHGAQFLTLLGNKVPNQSHNGARSGRAPAVTGIRHTLRSHTRQSSMPKRLIQYPPPPSKGAITVTTEDLECLRDGEFLNDVIIDFYLKYLQLERADRDVAERSHIFSSFFYKQLTRKANSSEEEAGCTAQYRRHGRVRTWTRNVDIFSKDYLFIPVNQEAHWYLVVICFPGLLQPECVPWKKSQTGSLVDPKGNSKDSTLKSRDLPNCTVLTCQRNMVTRRPCILIMDSLKLSHHYRIYTLLQEYLQVEWEVRRGTPRLFNKDNIKASHCKVPLQDNSSDCGLYLLQYVESFLQNPVVHFDLPLQLERWFPRQQVRRKRAEIRELVLQLYQKQVGGAVQSS